MQDYLDFVNPVREGGGVLSTGSIVGVAVAGVVAMLAIIAIVGALVMRRRRLARARKSRDVRFIASSESSKVRA